MKELTMKLKKYSAATVDKIERAYKKRKRGEIDCYQLRQCMNDLQTNWLEYFYIAETSAQKKICNRMIDYINDEIEDLKYGSKSYGL